MPPSNQALDESTLNRAIVEIITASRLQALKTQQPVVKLIRIEQLISMAKEITAGQAGSEVPDATSDGEEWDAGDLIEAPPMPDLTAANVFRAVKKLARAWNATINDAGTVLTINVHVPIEPKTR